MSRKLISSQPLKEDLEDLENIDFFKKREKQVTFNAGEDSKERHEPHRSPVRSPPQPDRRREQQEEEEEDLDVQSNKRTTRRYHQLQVIDEDTEHFKTKLDNLLNNFRAETISEFMSIKRSLLEEQTDAIESETRKYSRLLETRTNELDKTKEMLAKKVRELERAEVITHVVADWSGMAKTKRRNALLLAKCFNAFKDYKKYKVMTKKMVKMGNIVFKAKTVARVFGAWKDYYINYRHENLKQEADSNLNRELAELAAKYNKEIELLTGRLNEALHTIEESNKSKEEIQDNLKKAFMRGVCALNFEAMSILKNKGTNDEEELSEQEVLNRQIESMSQGNPNLHSLIINPVDETTSIREEREPFREISSHSPPKKNIVFYQNPKLESKEMRWRDAPVVGTSQSSEKKLQKDSILRPSSYAARPENKENDKYDNYPETQIHDHVSHNQEDEGRVIKVNHGKSYGVSANASAAAASSKQVKSTDKTVTVNSNKVSQLKAQISKVKK